jgi:putative hemolysin
MGIVSVKEFSKVLNVDKIGFVGTSISLILMRILKISTINKKLNKKKDLEGLTFIDAMLNDLGVTFEIPEEDLRRIPKKGAFITISNHPLGGIDGLLLLKILLTHRSDFSVIANFLLQRISPIKPYILAVNPFENYKDVKSSIQGVKRALLHLKGDKPLGIFPAGEVSTSKDENNKIVDKPWEEGAIKIIKKAKVPVLPIYFHAKNSKLFYTLASMSDMLRTAKLPSEILTQRDRVIKIRIGNPISVADQAGHISNEAFSAFLRKKTYMLAHPFQKKKLLDVIPKKLKIPKVPKKIAGAPLKEIILQEIELLRAEDKRLLESKNYEVFLASATIMPNILQEIGRLREITFREVGEGTNKAIDLDSFDRSYYHLFLWDTTTQQIAGAYRIGFGSILFPKYGIDGFYLQDLFRFEPELYDMMESSIEMGRAFIIKEYQRKPMPLFLLWKGVVHTTLRYPEHTYLIGGVSISNKFSDFSKGLMIEFMKSNYYDPWVAQYIKPKKEYKVKLKDGDKDFVFNESAADLNKFDRIIDEVEPGSLRMPVLLKKYIKQNAKVVAFNVDPLFNNAIDGLMYIKIADLPESTVKPVMEEFQIELEKKYAAGNFKEDL